MNVTRSLAIVTVSCGMCFARAVPASPPATPVNPGARGAAPAVAAVPAVLDVEKTKLTKEQFDKLPDAQVLEFRGEWTTVRDLRAAFEAAQARRARALADLKGRFESYRANVLAEQQAKIDAQNARARADWEKVRARSTVALPR